MEAESVHDDLSVVELVLYVLFVISVSAFNLVFSRMLP